MVPSDFYSCMEPFLSFSKYLHLCLTEDTNLFLGWNNLRVNKLWQDFLGLYEIRLIFSQIQLNFSKFIFFPFKLLFNGQITLY